ncbi:MAG: hypothetical protein E7607_03455 [Ruminococcaceae bacterium]|nr:hypothetical protein [Oscillospiraceae bacterium]
MAKKRKIWYNISWKDILPTDIFLGRCDMLKKGGYVVYRSEGVCIISDVREESFGAIGQKEEYYILTPVSDPRSTVYVPAKNEKLCACMRKLLCASEIIELCNSLKNERIEWLSDSRGRNNIYRDIISAGDRRDLIILINTILEKSDDNREHGRKIVITDENALKRAKKMLFDEFSASTDISSEEDIIPLLKGEISLSDKKMLLH